MQVLSKTDWEILNATADDWENLEQIYTLIDSQSQQTNGIVGGSGKLQEIAEGIKNLIATGLFEARWEDGTSVAPDSADLSYIWRAWFRMTPEGKKVWQDFGK
jgi:hypothetical protein